ncbi:endonuclease V [Paenibacillus sp. PK3_47]|uniref:endonuclease V n=1 Tax=Paenibacillus sp. PK3_47 TaxID=2072642 RepID=UPI00201D4410|nr:endonuclease V [Paenibacillus sp. PK3_47]UQZ34117.1 endonuclease V [Paenibacillus sp. PK3_47]
MIIAIDVYYEEHRARAAGVIFERWEDARPLDIIINYTENPQEYEPGAFYKRELPCILELLKLTDIKGIHTIVVDGYVYLNDGQKPGLGHYVYTHFSENIPVIGVAKTPFHHNGSAVQKIYRGKSAKPLYITAAGMSLAAAAENVQKMHGEHRFPHLLKLLDRQTKEGNL